MDRRPSFQFYPADWRNNANLRRCSWAARGAWVEIMGLAHDSDEYGILRWSLKEIAQAIGCPLALVKELSSKGVLKGCDSGLCEPYIYTPRSARKNGLPVTLLVPQDGPIWYSSRMLKDEHLRIIRGDATRFKPPEDEAPTGAPMAPIGATKDAASIGIKSDGSTSSSSSTGKPSVAIATGAGAPKADLAGPVSKPPRKPPDPEKQELWATGRSLLIGQGMTNDAAGSFLGGLVKDYGHIRVLELVREASADPKADVKTWLVAACQERAAKAGNKQVALEARNAAVAASWVPPELRGDAHAA